MVKKMMAKDAYKGRHVGQRCFVIGSGPSIADMDLAWLKDEVTICVNQSFKALEFDPTYLCIGDRELWPNIRDRYAQMSSRVICTTGLNGTVGSDYPGDNLDLVIPLDKTNDVTKGAFRWDLECVCKAYNVIGETVLPFVLFCGFQEVFLIGCDCTDDGYFYPDNESARTDFTQKVYPQAIQAYAQIQRIVQETFHVKTSIHNAGYGGKLEVFPRCSFDSLRPGAESAPLVIGYHTHHVEYRDLAVGMKASVERFGLECILVEYEGRTALAHDGVKLTPMANWVTNCAICAEFVLKMMHEYPDRDIVFLDADAIMQKRPALYLDGPREYDFAVPFLTNLYVENELTSNSMYFKSKASGSPSLLLVELWLREQQERLDKMEQGYYRHPYREAWDQKVLQDVLNDMQKRTSSLRLYRLPMSYGKIMPTSAGVELTPDTPFETAVITQHQASREMKNNV